jgi:hypothetical protein
MSKPNEERGFAQPLDAFIFAVGERRLRARRITAAEQLALVLAGWPVLGFLGSVGAVITSRHGGKLYVAVPTSDLARLASMTDDEIVAALDGAGRAWGDAVIANRPDLADAIANSFNADAASGRPK